MRGKELHLEYDTVKEKSGMSVIYDEKLNGESSVSIQGGPGAIAASFSPERIDEAHILYMEASEILKGRTAAGESVENICAVLERLFALYTK